MPLIGTVTGNFWAGARASASASNLLLYLDAGNVLSYPTSGSTWFDLSTYNLSATLFNTPTYLSNFNGILQFDDTSLEYSTVPNIGSLTNWTIEVWFRITTSLAGKVTSILSNEFDLVNKLNFSIGTNNAPANYNLAVGFFDGSWHNTTGITPALNTWYQVVGTYDGTTIKQYVDGQLSGGTLNYSGTSQSGGEVRIMRRWDSPLVAGNLVDGDLAIVKIYNKALSDAEVLTNYNNTYTRFLLPTPTPTPTNTPTPTPTNTPTPTPTNTPVPPTPTPSSTPAADTLRASLTGTASLTAYDAAPVNSWVRVTGGEYAATMINVAGATKYWMTDALMALPGGGGWSANFAQIISAGSVSAIGPIGTNNYLIGFSTRNTTVSGSVALLSASTYQGTYSIVNGYVGLPGTASPGGVYYIRKAPTLVSDSNIHLGIVHTNTIQLITTGLVGGYDNTVPYSTWSSWSGSFIPIQAIATTTKSW